MDAQHINALPQLFGNLTVQDLLTALKDSQVQNQALRNEIRALRTAPAPIDAVSGPPLAAPVSSPAPTGNVDPVLDEASGQASILGTKESKDKFQVAARRLIVTGHVWWEKKNIFGIGQALAQRELDAALALYLQGTAAAENMEKVVKMRLVLHLYITLAPQYHVFVGGTIPGSYHKLEKIMRDAATDIRPIILTRIKANAVDICEGLVPHDRFGGDFDRFADPLCRKLVGYQADKEGIARLCPCLYVPGKRVGGDTLFRSPAIVKILICVLWGGSALRTKKFQTKTTYGGLWEVKEVTPAAIAFAAITLRFLLSGDPSFTSERGAKSKINYFSDFEFYVSVIEKKLAKASRSMLATLQLYNDEVFPTFRHAKSAAPNLHANLEENSEEEEILRGLDEVEAEVYSDDADFTAFADAVDLQVNTQAPIAIEDVVEVAPVPLAAPHVAATTGKGGRKRSNPSKETPARRSARGQGLEARSNTDQPPPAEETRRRGRGRKQNDSDAPATTLPTRSTRLGARSGTKRGARAVAIAEVIEDKNDDEASENDDADDDGNGNGDGQGNSAEGDDNDDEEEEEEEEDLEYAH